LSNAFSKSFIPLILELIITPPFCKEITHYTKTIEQTNQGEIAMEYIGFADANEFVKVSGISKNDLEKHVYSNKEFQQSCMYRFGKNHKRYIKIRPAIDFIEQNILVPETAL